MCHCRKGVCARPPHLRRSVCHSMSVKERVLFRSADVEGETGEECGKQRESTVD